MAKFEPPLDLATRLFDGRKVLIRFSRVPDPSLGFAIVIGWKLDLDYPVVGAEWDEARDFTLSDFVARRVWNP